MGLLALPEQCPRDASILNGTKAEWGIESLWIRDDAMKEVPVSIGDNKAVLHIVAACCCKNATRSCKSYVHAAHFCRANTT